MQEIDNKLKTKLKKYFKITEEAIKTIKISKNLDSKSNESAADLLDLATKYFADAKYFEDKGDIVNAYGAVVYAHAFLDIGARLGFFDVDDSKLFMVD